MNHLFERYKEIIDDWDAFSAALLEPLPTCFWANTTRLTVSELINLLRSDGIPFQALPWTTNGFRLGKHIPFGARWEFKTGLMHIQEEVSMMPVHVLGAAPNHRVLDMCAAPGNKTLQVAVELGGKGTVIANERYGSRIPVLRSATERLSLPNISITKRDAATLPERWGFFDRILADVPCSCEGNSRKSIGKLRGDERGFKEKLVRTQKQILHRAATLLRPGGRMVYSTCTYAPEENEGVVSHVLENMKGDLKIVPFALNGVSFCPGLTEWDGQRFPPQLKHAARFYPHLNNTGGFFIAVLEKL